MDWVIIKMAESSGSEGLDGQWAEILRTGKFDGENYTPEDLDSLVSEYRKRKDGEKSPLALGLPPSASNPVADEPIGRIDGLRRVGNSIEAKCANVDPRVEQLYARGVFPKKSVQLKRSPEGLSLQRVGLISPVWKGQYQTDEATPSLDELMQKSFGSKAHTFQESPLANQWLELFQSGDYGGKGNFSNSDLDEIVRNFDPSFHEPPAVIGHPAHDAPAYGWVDGLRRNGNKLLGKLKQVDPKFEEMVKTGKFKKRSISLYKTGKGWMLRHVGFLGAQPPEVKGLANAAFREDSIRFVTLTFGESGTDAGAAIGGLKSRGYWMPEFDHFCFPAIFAELDGSPTLNVFVNFLEQLQDQCNIDLNSSRLAHRAQNFARFHGVSFGEALDEVRQRDAQISATSKAVKMGLPGARLSELAYQVMNSRGVSFGEALSEVAAEYPELTL